jgi:aryl-alcohol dehydrogenase-like predicted oxidoreductase
MEYLNLKSDDFEISRIGLGRIRLDSDPKKSVQRVETESIHTINAALDFGINYLDAADFYGSGLNEMLIKKALKDRKRDDVFISVKFGEMTGLDGKSYGLDVRPQSVQNYLGYTLKRLGTDYVDLYQPYRIDPNIPVEETIGAVADMVKAGHVMNVGISEVSADILHRANATHPISLVEVQYSLLNRSIEASLLPAARELGIGVVAFGVLFSGLIGGSAPQKKISTISRKMPAAELDILSRNMLQLNALQAFATEKGATLAQLAIAWVLAQGEDIMAVVGSRTIYQVNDTVKALNIKLSEDDLNRIEQIIPKAQATSSYIPDLKVGPKGLYK